ncbi:MAG: cold shock domain-containing protein [Acidobacteriota bacterium]|nr:cold shock domain-containing protein [Acidobacteriota bacterium]
MATGTIRRLVLDKGFGFVRDESGVDHFFHRSSVRGVTFEGLHEGQRVEFEEARSDKGPRAEDVRPSEA